MLNNWDGKSNERNNYLHSTYSMSIFCFCFVFVNCLENYLVIKTSFSLWTQQQQKVYSMVRNFSFIWSITVIIKLILTLPLSRVNVVWFFATGFFVVLFKWKRNWFWLFVCRLFFVYCFLVLFVQREKKIFKDFLNLIIILFFCMDTMVIVL